MRKVDWANLNELPLSLVLEKLEVQTDYVRFGVVCKNWLSAAKLNHKNHQFRNVLPMLMILSKKLSRIHAISQTKKISLYNILSKKDYPIQFSHPSINTMKLCLGCSHGWLALVDDNNAITLVNPFKCSIAPISLPPLKSLKKVTLSADPFTSPSDYVVAVIYNFGSLAFKRPSQSFWIRVNTNEFSFTDVVFYKGLIFVDSTDTIVSFKLNNPSSDDSFDPNFSYYEKMASTPYFFPPELYSYGRTYNGRAYFVKSLTRDIWMMKRFLIGRDLIKPCIFKLELDAQSGKLEHMNKLESLEDSILFVGSVGDSISVPASAFSKLEKDSIYFVNGLETDIYIFNVKDGSVQRPPSVLSFNCMQQFWVLPQLHWD
ncbi:DUF295 family protein [Medicago truncatula]|nr:DUF295 family protein [Medicago truncatula]